jgi:hypothetical protein
MCRPKGQGRRGSSAKVDPATTDKPDRGLRAAGVDNTQVRGCACWGAIPPCSSLTVFPPARLGGL